MANKKGIPKAEWLLFYNSQEPHIQAMMDKYPPGKYIMTEDAPYGLSCPGQPVTLHAYNDDGTVGVVVRAEEKIPAALEHERMLAEEHNKLDRLEEFHKQDTLVRVDPKYIKLVEAMQISEGPSTFRHEPCWCPHCNAKLDSATMTSTNSVLPGDGDFSVCLYCANYLAFNVVTENDEAVITMRKLNEQDEQHLIDEQGLAEELKAVVAEIKADPVDLDTVEYGEGGRKA